MPDSNPSNSVFFFCEIWEKKIIEINERKMTRQSGMKAQREQQIWGLRVRAKYCRLKPLKSSYQTHTEDKTALYDVQTGAREVGTQL